MTDGYDSDGFDGDGFDADYDEDFDFDYEEGLDVECDYEGEAEGLEIDFEGQDPQESQESPENAFDGLVESYEPEYPEAIENWLESMEKGEHKTLDPTRSWTEESEQALIDEQFAEELRKANQRFKSRQRLESSWDTIDRIKAQMDRKRAGIKDELDRIGGEI